MKNEIKELLEFNKNEYTVYKLCTQHTQFMAYKERGSERLNNSTKCLHKTNKQRQHWRDYIIATQ